MEKKTINIITGLVFLGCLSRLYYYVWEFAPDFPCWDEWSLLHLFLNDKEGALSIWKLMEPHQGHILFFPKLVFLCLYNVFGWSPRLECFLIVTLIGLGGLLLISIYQKSIQYTKFALSHFMLWPCLLIIFSLNQGENLLWGFQVAWAMVLVFSLATLWFLQKLSYTNQTSKSWLLFMYACIFAVLASGSSAMGIMVWPAFLPVLLFMPKSHHKSRMIIIWIIFSVIFFVIIYMLKTGISQGVTPSAYGYINFFTSLLGSYFVISAPLNEQPTILFIAQITGCLMILCFVINAIIVILARERLMKTKCIPWISLGLFAAGFVLMVTISRSPISSNQWLYTRYSTFSQFFWISILACSGVLMSNGFSNRINLFKRIEMQFGVAIILMCVFYSRSARSIEFGLDWSYVAQMNRAIFMNVSSIPDNSKVNDIAWYTGIKVKDYRQLYESAQKINVLDTGRIEMKMGVMRENFKIIMIEQPAAKGSFGTKGDFEIIGKLPASAKRGEYPVVFISPDGAKQFISATVAYIEPEGDVKSTVKCFTMPLSREYLNQFGRKFKIWVYYHHDNSIYELADTLEI